ncbi:MAG: nucleoside monophosphate kinase [Patescibacteria group bacterium]
MENKRKIVSFIGLPASGKGTQARVFAKMHNFDLIGMGDLIRAVLEENKGSSDPFIIEIKKKYDAGVPQPDEVAFDLLKKKLSTLNKDGAVFDNFPFTVKQAELLINFAKENDWELPVLVYIKLDPETTIERIAHRKICPQCNRIYNKKDISACEDCGVALISRVDDNEDIARTRIEHYVPKINELVNYYKQIGAVLEVNGEPSIEEVTVQIENDYDKYLK